MVSFRRSIQRYCKYLELDTILQKPKLQPTQSLFKDGTIAMDSLRVDTFRRNAKLAQEEVKDKKWLGYIQIGKLFRDKTTKSCDVSIKPRGWNADFVEFYPKSYTTVNSNGTRTTLPTIELDYFEMAAKNQGNGTKKIQEIINYAKKKTEGRFVVSAVQFDKESPVLFYYRNGLRSTDPKINSIIEQVSAGKLNKSHLPENLFMYLPVK